MDIPLDPAQDVNIRASNINGVLSGLDDTTKTWTVTVRLTLAYPNWNKDEDGSVIDPSVNIFSGSPHGREIRAQVKVSRADIATQAGLPSPDDVPDMKAGDMETAIIAVAMAKVQIAFPGLTLS